jgi:hypothetical protein
MNIPTMIGSNWPSVFRDEYITNSSWQQGPYGCHPQNIIW